MAQAYGSDLPPGAQTVNGAANYRASESNVQSVVAGTYVEQNFDLDGRFFLTAAMRADGASNFGRDFKTAWYPKGGFSWLISEEGFFPRGSFINSLRYRFAYGASGVQPQATDALAAVNFGSVFVNGQSRTGASLNALGNPDLGPERVTEYETGFDMELLDGRVQWEATAYYRKSVDALVRRAMPRSIGITGTGQLDNVGSVRNMGIEADVQAEVFSLAGATFSMNVNGSLNSNVLLELAEGLRPPEDRFIKFVEGWPLYGQWDRPVLGWNDDNGDGVLQADEVQVGDSIIFIGNTNPTRMLNFTPTISLLGGRLYLSSLFVYRGGWVQTNFSELNKCNFGSCRARNDPEAPLHLQAQYIAFTKPGLTYAGYQEDGTYTRWAEALVSYTFQPGCPAAARARGQQRDGIAQRQEPDAVDGLHRSRPGGDGEPVAQRKLRDPLGPGLRQPHGTAGALRHRARETQLLGRRNLMFAEKKKSRLLVAVAGVLLIGCDALTEVDAPDVVQPQDVDNAEGAASFGAAALNNLYGQFATMTSTTGRFSDEFYLSDSFNAWAAVDYREQAVTFTEWGPVYLGRGRTFAQMGIDLYLEHAPEERAEIGQLYAVRGFAALLLGEVNCNGTPLSEVVDLKPVYGGPITSDSMTTRALAELDVGLEYAAADERILNLVRVARGRALTNLGRFSEAASAVAGVPTDYVLPRRTVRGRSRAHRIPSSTRTA